MAIEAKQKKLLLAVGILLLLVFVVRVIPLIKTWYEDSQKEVIRLEKKIEGIRRITQEEAQWHQKANSRSKQSEQLKQQLFVGESPEVISARIQATLKDQAKKIGLSISSMKLPDFFQNKEWLLIHQEMDFSATVPQMETFLNHLEKANPRLRVILLDIRKSRNKKQKESRLEGALGVSAFSRLP